MPQIKIDYIVSFSSEHPDHPASNLLCKNISNKRWVSLEKGEQSLSIVFQLEKSTQITSIHVGNYHSALVEVLVGRSESPGQQYEVLLCASSFMTPGDARNSVNISNVRTFKAEQFVESIRTQKWDRIRVVCSQPYNRHVQYGLSFIHFFSSDTIVSNNDTPSSSQSSLTDKMLGKFKLKDSESDEELGNMFIPGELFAKTKNKSDLSTEAQIRQASSPNNFNNNKNLLVKTTRPNIDKINKKVDKTDVISPPSRKRDKIMYLDDDDDNCEKIDSIIKRDRVEKERATIPLVNIKDNQKDKQVESNNKKPKIDDKINRNLVESKPSMKRIHLPEQDDKKEKKVKQEPVLSIKRGNDCLKGVIFVISGYVNPKRSNIRDTAVSLGAKYSTDWHNSCTHLICAFPNTPKHNEVKKSGNNGIVVTAEWVEDCGKEKAHLPWKWYATDPNLREPKQDIGNLNQAGPSTNLIKDNVYDNREEDEEDTDDDIERILKLTEAQSKEERVKNTLKKMQISESDIDDEINPLETPLKLTEAQSKSDIKEDEINPFDAPTESDEEFEDKIVEDISINKILGDFFSGIKFYLDPNIAEDEFEISDLKRYILAYEGEVVDEWPDVSIDVAITTPNYVHLLRDGKGKKCTFLIPEWVWKCHHKETLYPYEKYLIR